MTMYNDHYALVRQYKCAEPLTNNVASEQRRIQIMGELSFRGVKLVRIPGHENALADFLSSCERKPGGGKGVSCERTCRSLKLTETCGWSCKLRSIRDATNSLLEIPTIAEKLLAV